MECLIGIQGLDFVLLASDTSSNRSIVSMKQDSDKFFKLSDHVAMVVCGESGDTVQFSEYISKNIQLYKMINGYQLSPQAISGFTRAHLADFLRRSPFNVNMVIGGHDKDSGPVLYYMDYLASLNKMPFVMHGYGGLFGLSILDRHYRPNLNQVAAVELVEKVIKEVGHRFIVNLPAFNVRIIDKHGIKELPSIKGKILV